MEALLKELIVELKGFKNEVNTRFDQVDTRFNQVDARFEQVDARFDRLEKGQEEIKKSLKHHTTLMTENFTNIRRDLRIKIQDNQADVDLLFKEVEGVKRKTNKIEQKLK